MSKELKEEDAQKTLNAMVEFIESNAKEEVRKIQNRAQEEYNIKKESLIKSAKDKLKNEYENKRQQYAIKKRIERSAAITKTKLKKMEARNKCVELIMDETKEEIIKLLKNDRDVYKEWLRKLLIQGLIKMMEMEVIIKCRKSDLDLVQAVIEPASDEFGKRLKEEVPRLQGKEIKCKISIDENFLPEYNTKESGLESCIGGIYIMSKTKKIICKNTIDERLSLVYQDALPNIRRELFPN